MTKKGTALSFSANFCSQSVQTCQYFQDIRRQNGCRSQALQLQYIRQVLLFCEEELCTNLKIKLKAKFKKSCFFLAYYQTLRFSSAVFLIWHWEIRVCNSYLELLVPQSIADFLRRLVMDFSTLHLQLFICDPSQTFIFLILMI